MKSVADEFDVFDSGAQRFVDVASVLASNARLTDLLQVLQRERDQLDLLLDVTNAVVTQLDTRELFRAVAPALRRCCSADVAALSVYDPEAGVLRHHVCDAPEDFRTASDVPMPTESTIEGSATGYVFKTGEPKIFSVSDLEAFPESTFICSRGIRTACAVPLATAHGVMGTLNLGAFAEDAFSPRQFPLLTRVAGQIAIALRKRVLVRTHRIAERPAGAREAVPRRRNSHRAPVRRDRRPQPGPHSRAARDQDRCADGFDGAHHRRDRVGEGAGRARDPRSQPAP